MSAWRLSRKLDSSPHRRGKALWRQRQWGWRTAAGDREGRTVCRKTQSLGVLEGGEKKNHDAICRKNLGHEFCLADAESGPLSRIWGSWFPCNLLKGFYASADIYHRLALVALFNPDAKSVLMQTNWPSRVRVVRPTTSFVAVKYRSFVVWSEHNPRSSVLV